MISNNDSRSTILTIVFATIFLMAAMVRTTPADAQTTAGASALLCVAQVVGQAEIDASKVIGQDKCAECHKSEVAAWSASPHAAKSFQNLSHAKAPEFAAAMGVSAPYEASLCGDCHSTHTSAKAVIKGVSCERCHGAAGPASSGWFAVHSDFGNSEKDRQKETEAHHKERVAACKKLGMNSSRDVYEIAKNCISCHTVPNEKLVNAGHPTTTRFELVEYSQGAVRHNFQLDQSVNAASPSLWLDAKWNGPGRTSENRKKLMYVIGQLADLEVSLRNRAMASDGDFGAAAGRRISSAIRKLDDLEIAEVKQAIAALEGIDRKALRTYSAGNKKLFGDAADKVAEAAQAFAKNHDGSKLGEIKVPDDAVGDPYKP